MGVEEQMEPLRENKLLRTNLCINKKASFLHLMRRNEAFCDYSIIAPFNGITKFDLINKTNYFLFHQSTVTSIRKRQQLFIFSCRLFYHHSDF